MAISYADKRGRYAGQAPWDFSPGATRGDNPVPTKESSTTLASRGVTAPRDAFRVTTTEDENLLMQAAIAEEIAKRQAQGDSGGANGLVPEGVSLLEASAAATVNSGENQVFPVPVSNTSEDAETFPRIKASSPSVITSRPDGASATVGSSNSAIVTAASILGTDS